MIGTVTAVVIASRGTTASDSRSGSSTITTTVISGKMVIQVRSAILCGGGGGAPGLSGRVNQVSSPLRNWVRIGPTTRHRPWRS
jgi:hypothetical protein